MESLIEEAEEIWGRLVDGEYIDTKKITGVNQTEIAKQIQKQLRDLKHRKQSSGNPDVLYKNEFGKIVAKDEALKKPIVNNNVDFIEYTQKGKKRFAVIQAKGDAIDHKSKPPIFLTSAKSKDELLKRLDEKGYGFIRQRDSIEKVKRPQNTRYPRAFIAKYGRDFYRGSR